MSILERIEQTAALKQRRVADHLAAVERSRDAAAAIAAGNLAKSLAKTFDLEDVPPVTFERHELTVDVTCDGLTVRLFFDDWATGIPAPNGTTEALVSIVRPCTHPTCVDDTTTPVRWFIGVEGWADAWATPPCHTDGHHVEPF